jgi:predicted RNase H-like HicB family nuclease
MLPEYVDEAMARAVYDKLEDGTYYGKIPQCLGVVALAETLYKCERALRSSLEGWLIVKIRHQDELPCTR